MSQRLFFGFVVVMLVCVLKCSSIHADMISHTVIDTNGGLGFPVGFAGTFLVPKYLDPGGSPLIKVTLEVTGNSTGGIKSFDNEAGAGGMATVGIGSQIKVTGPIPTGGDVFDQLLVRAEPVNTLTGAVGPDNEPGGAGPDFIGTDSITITGTGSTDTKSSSRMTLFELSPYMGAGNVLFDFSTLGAGASTSTTGGGGFFTDPTTIRSDYTAVVTYTFDAVPEPSSLALLAIASLYGLARKRRCSR